MDNIDGLYPVRTITDFRDMIDQSAALFGTQPAFLLRDKDGAYRPRTFLEFQKDVRSLGTALWELGLQGSAIAVMGVNSYPWCLTYLAVTCGLGVIVPIDKELPFEDVSNILRVSGAKLLVADRKSLKMLKARNEELPPDLILVSTHEAAAKNGILSFDGLMENGRRLTGENAPSAIAYRNAPIDPDAMSVLIFTSGTSGAAKGVMLSQHNICFVVMSNSSIADIHPGDQMLAVLPLHHTFECSLGFLAPIYNGSCNAFNESILRLPKDLQAVKPTVFFTVPLIMEKMHDRIIRTASARRGGKSILRIGKAITGIADKFGIDATDKVFGKVKDAFGGRLRLFIVGAASVRPDVVRDYKHFGIKSYVGYGLTECAPLVACNHDGLFTADSVGQPIPGVEVRIDCPDAHGVGEVLVRGPNVMLGYYQDEELTRTVIDEEKWLHTGDLGKIDKKGLIRLTGRAKNVIVTKNGENIYPEELEDALNRHPYVAESMVQGDEENESSDVVVHASIFPDMAAIREYFSKDGHEPTAEEISKIIGDAVKELNAKLPSYKMIKEVTVQNTEFIKTTTAKIKRFLYTNEKSNEKANEKVNEKADEKTAEKITEIKDSGDKE